MIKENRYIRIKIKLPFSIAHPNLLTFSLRVRDDTDGVDIWNMKNIQFGYKEKMEVSTVSYDIKTIPNHQHTAYLEVFYNGKSFLKTNQRVLYKTRKEYWNFELGSTTAQTVSMESKAEHEKKFGFKSRKLHQDEINMLKEIFTNPKYPLDFNKINIRRNKFFGIDNAITPFGDINFPPPPEDNRYMKDGVYHHYYMENFTKREGNIPANPKILVHEVVHAWQYQYANILFSDSALRCQVAKFITGGMYDPYKYTLVEPNNFQKNILDNSSIRGGVLFLHQRSYNPEALATIVEDYYDKFLKKNAKGIRGVDDLHNSKIQNEIRQYQAILKGYVMKK